MDYYDGMALAGWLDEVDAALGGQRPDAPAAADVVAMETLVGWWLAGVVPSEAASYALDAWGVEEELPPAAASDWLAAARSYGYDG